jgi:alkyl sulfatase BDS1-like metallo-beta-lactamase superfamily hydrolase
MAAEPQGSKDATPPTCAHNRSFLDALPFGDRADFEDAARGFIGTLPKVEFRNAEGRVIFSLEDYAFLAHEQAPDTSTQPVAAGRQHEQRPVQVTDRSYQVRGFDISNMTIIGAAAASSSSIP